MDAATGTAYAVFAFVIAVVYFLPALLASHRGCKATAAIAIIDLFLGWTFVGWVAALAWAVSGEKRPPRPDVPTITPDTNLQR